MEGSPMRVSPRPNPRRRSSLTDEAPPEYLCPITCELMSDPVMIVTGQTYERSSIRQWISEGHRTCPVTRLPLSNIDLVPNYALRNAIRTWALRRGIDLPDPESAPPPRPSGATYRSTANNVLQATGTSLVWDPALPDRNSPAVQAVFQLYKGTQADKEAAVVQLCTIANEGLESGRYVVSQAGAIPPLIVALGNGSNYCKETAARCFRFLCRSNNPVISQSCTAAIPGLIKLLSEGTPPSKESACGALVNLSAKTDVNKFTIAAAGGIPPMVNLLRAEAPRSVTCMTHECASAVLCNLAFNNDNRVEIAQAGAIPLLVQVAQKKPTPDAGEYAVHALGSLACEINANGTAIVQAGALPILVDMLQNGNQWSKEAAARTLRNVSFFENLRPIVIDSGAVPVLTTTTETGSARAAESARAALNNLRRQQSAIFRNRASQQEPASGVPADDTRPMGLSPQSQGSPANSSASRRADSTRLQHGTSLRLRGAGARVHPEAQAPPAGSASASAAPGSSAHHSAPSSPVSTRRRMVVRSAYRPAQDGPNRQ